ncbi:MAG TPA: hypothetical protein VGR00_08265, partial [Thermoanaerobaculia bacterium]|nr:hypothetical protein [Thermoanaerobaculia bacterium]
AWESVGRDIVAAPRLTQLAGLGDPARAREDLPALLTPSDLYRIGRRLVSPRSPALPVGTAARRAEAAWNALVSRYGEAGAHERLAEFGPRPATFAGRFSLADIDLPPYEMLATYRVPLLLADRLYDLKIVLARRAAEAGIPAALLPILVGPALDETLARASLSFAYDWEALVRDARLLSAGDVERYLDTALNEGRIVREGTAR